jgi:hypothetical protein
MGSSANVRFGRSVPAGNTSSVSVMPDGNAGAVRSHVHKQQLMSFRPDYPDWSTVPEAATWRLIPGTEASRFYGVAREAAPVRGLLIWPSAGGDAVLLVAPDLLPACYKPDNSTDSADAGAVDPDWTDDADGTAVASARRRLRQSRDATQAAPAAADFSSGASVRSLSGDSAASSSANITAGSRPALLGMASACYLPGLGDTGFASYGDARHALLDALTQASARAYEASGAVLPRALRAAVERRMRSTPVAAGRQTYILPSVSRGARTILAVRILFYGQASTAVGTDTDMRTLLDAVVTELTRAAFGAATFSYTLPTSTVTLSSSTATCTSDYSTMESDAKAQVQATLGINPASFKHFVLLMPSCSSLGWSGLAYVPGGTAWINGAAVGSSEGVMMHELGHNLGALRRTRELLQRSDGNSPTEFRQLKPVICSSHPSLLSLTQHISLLHLRLPLYRCPRPPARLLHGPVPGHVERVPRRRGLHVLWGGEWTQARF